MKLKIKKGSTVQVIAGQEKGKKGTVLAVNSAAMKILVEGVKIQTHYDKKEGLLKKEGFIAYSNVMLVGEATPKAAGKKKTAAKKTTKQKSA